MGAEVKIPILGLQNAGKSSLIRTLIREFKSLDNIKPTKGIERIKFSFIGKDLLLWDFGGQEKYRNDYRKKADLYFSEVQECMYIVDIQDQNTFNDVITYFNEIIAELKKHSPNATINIVFNKLDPGMESDDQYKKLITTFGEKLIDAAKPMPGRVYTTSIFNPLSVIRCFSKPLFGNTTLYDNFSLLFMDLVNKGIGIEFIMILTQELLEIGNFFLPDLDQKKMKSIAHEIIKTFEDKKMKVSDLAIEVEEEMIRVIQFDAGGKHFYFTYGFNKMKVPEPSIVNVEAHNVLEDVKKFMKYF